MLVDTHAHLIFPELAEQIDEVLARASKAGVSKIVCVGTSSADSAQAVDLAQQYPGCWATVGLHPHDGSHRAENMAQIKSLADKPKVIAIGECGLDYYHQRTGKPQQAKALAWQIELALEHGLPLVFHVRDAFADFLKIVDNYPQARGVVHSFSSNKNDLKEVLARGFYVALNGIMTFTKDSAQLAAAKTVPLDRLLLETDAPFLTPVPNRGKVNEPAYVKNIAESLANLRGESLERIARATTRNATKLFNL